MEGSRDAEKGISKSEVASMTASLKVTFCPGHTNFRIFKTLQCR
jgi:hypothetical protein